MIRQLVRCLGGLALGLTALVAIPADAGAGPSATPSASAPETYNRPADGVFQMAGHGWGHGHGLSQYGAAGAASQKNMSGAQITGFYYPNTTLGTLAASPIRVRIACDGAAVTCGTNGITFSAANGLVLVDRGASSPTATALPTDRSRWRVKLDSAGFHLEGLTGSTWAPYPSAAAVYRGPVELNAAAGSASRVVRVNYSATTGTVWREYRGVQRVIAAGGAMQLINVLSMEEYLLGVVPRESISSWPLETLVAQAVAARSYAAYAREHAPSTRAYDICDTTACQVYGGSAYGRASGGSVTAYDLEPDSTTKAVNCDRAHYPASADPCSKYAGPLVRTYRGGAIFAQFSASNGGWSTATTSSNTDVRAYLVAQADPYDGLTNSAVHSWSAKLPVAEIERQHPSLGRLLRMKVTERDGNGEWGGRVKTVVLEGQSSTGAATTVTLTGSQVAGLYNWPSKSDGLRSSWFKPLYTSAVVYPPRTAVRGATVTITGRVPSGTTTFDLFFKFQGTDRWTSRRVTAKSDSTFSTSTVANQDFQVYAAAGGVTSSVRSTDVHGTTIRGPFRTDPGQAVRAYGYAEPGSTVSVCWSHRPGTCATIDKVTASPTGVWGASHYMSVAHSYYATADGYRSVTWGTKLR